jgi:Polyketide cyclase / dehydrase and lipid transport
MKTADRHPRSAQSGTIHVPLPPERAFDLFTAEGERLWAPGWDPKVLSESVFLTGHGGEETIWTIVEADRQAGRLCYSRVSPGVRAGTVRVNLSPDGAGSRVEVSYDMTALGPSGVEAVTKMDRDGFAAMLRDWERLIGEAIRANATDTVDFTP